MRALFLILLLAASVGRAGVVNIHGGGHGVIIGQRVYLLDLVEHGLEQTAGYNQRNPIPLGYPVEMAPILLHRLVPLEGLRFDLLTRKIDDAGSLDPVFAAALLSTIRNLSWSLTDNALKPVDSETVIQKPVVQLALRTGSEVLIDSALWSKMDDDNRVALVIHEGVAALAKSSLRVQEPIRTLVSNLFRSDFSSTPRQTANDLAYFPSRADLLAQLALSPSTQMFLSSQDVSGLRFVGMEIDDHYSAKPFESFHFLPVLKTKFKANSRSPRSSSRSGFETTFLNQRGPGGTLQRLPTCDSLRADHRAITELEVGYYTVDIKPVTGRDGSPEPRYSAGYTYHVRSRMTVTGTPSFAELGCSEDNERQLQHMNVWLQGFARF